MQKLRLLLYPFSLIYGLITAIRNLFYDTGIFAVYRHGKPVFVLGNLSAGGTGKSPHTEFLVRHLSKNRKVAILSRGYGRRTRGYIELDVKHSAREVGDEPLQFRLKFPQVSIAVCEKRVEGLKRLEQSHQPDVLVLDDAFQHRAVEGTCNILLTTYQNPFYDDCLLPTGNLREFSCGKKRANAIVMTKCPPTLTEEERKRIVRKINTPEIPVFFSRIAYRALKSISSEGLVFAGNKSEYNCLLITGVAQAKPLLQQLKESFKSVKHLNFADHRNFNTEDMGTILNLFDNFAEPKIIVTTEKDAVKLRWFEVLKKLPVFYQEIEVDFGEDELAFLNLIESYAK